MESKLNVVKFKDFITLKRGYDLPTRKRKTGNVPVLSSSGISGNHNEYKVDGPGVITGRSGLIGSVYYIRKEFWPLNTTLYVTDFKGNNPLYVYYKLKTINLKNFATGSSVPTLNRNHLDSIDVNIHDKEKQKKQIFILEKIDKKINLNRQIIANLEELSQTIFKHWFIDFEFPNQRNSPYNYNKEETSKDLPHGWKWEKLNHLFKINYGKNLPTKNLLDTGYPVYGGNGKIGYYSNYMYDDPKILISCRGAASGAIHVSQEHSFITNNSIVLDEIEKEYFYYFKELFSRETFKRYTTGSAQPQITIVNIKELKFLVPPKSLVIEFNKHQKPIFDFNSKLKQENSKLKSLRDTLLPKLMSGEIEIPDDVEVNTDELSI